MAHDPAQLFTENQPPHAFWARYIVQGDAWLTQTILNFDNLGLPVAYFSHFHR